MRPHTPMWVERRFGFYTSVHTFRWGFHFKLRRRGPRWRHLVVKLTRGSVFGHTRGRRMLWIGWWESVKGSRKQLNGFRVSLLIDRLPSHPPPTKKIPFFPQEDPRNRGRS